MGPYRLTAGRVKTAVQGPQVRSRARREKAGLHLLVAFRVDLPGAKKPPGCGRAKFRLGLNSGRAGPFTLPFERVERASRPF